MVGIGDLAEELKGVAMVIGAIAALVVAIAILTRRLSQGQVEIKNKLGEIKVTVDDVSLAVNHVGEDDPAPLIQRVKNLEASEQWKRDVLTLLAENLGVRLPPYPTDKENTQ